MRAALDALDAGSVARVSPGLPLRANLSALDNIALIPLYRGGFSAPEAARQGMALLEQLGYAGMATLRDPDMTPAQRFVTKLARALVLHRPRLVIDRPGAMLYDVDHASFVRQLCMRFDSGGIWEIFDYDWNGVLYPPALATVAGR